MKALIGQPVNYAMIDSTYFALIIQITTSKTYMPKMCKIAKLLPFLILETWTLVCW